MKSARFVIWNRDWCLRKSQKCLPHYLCQFALPQFAALQNAIDLRGNAVAGRCVARCRIQICRAANLRSNARCRCSVAGVRIGVGAADAAAADGLAQTGRFGWHRGRSRVGGGRCGRCICYNTSFSHSGHGYRFNNISLIAWFARGWSSLFVRLFNFMWCTFGWAWPHVCVRARAMCDEAALPHFARYSGN